MLKTNFKSLSFFIVASCVLFASIFSTSSAHIIGADTRTENFEPGEKSFKNWDQALRAKNSLAHLECKSTSGEWDQNSTSAFFVDAQSVADDFGLKGDFRTCESRLLVSVAHYFNERGGSKAICSVYPSFVKSSGGKTMYGDVDERYIGQTSDGYNGSVISNPSSDFSISKIKPLAHRPLNARNFGLSLCSKNQITSSSLGESCRGDFSSNIILPHLSRDTTDKGSIAIGLSFKAKLTSGACCIKDVDNWDIISHNCDMLKRSSGAPLLDISDPGKICEAGIQQGQKVLGKSELVDSDTSNYAISASSQKFTSALVKFIDQNCRGD